MLKPVSLGCGHSGCRECLTELVTKTLMPKCPMCRTELRADSICVNIALDHITSELAVECLSVGCGWKGSYGQAPEHFKTCPKLQVVCNNEECQHKSIREEMPNHIASCSKKKIPCSECHVCVKWELLQKHQAEQCPNAVIQCPLDCGSTIPRSSITLHLHQCPEKVYLCKVPECKKMMKRKDLTSHIMEAASSHYVLQLSEIKRLRRIIHNRCKPDRTLVEVESIVSFRWRLLNFPAMLRDQTDATGDDPITSEVFSCERHKWRGLLTDKKSLFLQLVSASHPITAEFRIVLMPGQEKQKEFRSKKTTLKEGEMWGGDVYGGPSLSLCFTTMVAHPYHSVLPLVN
ncbi:TNF receptor-associated factor 5 [Acropora cervicornis]|uniref:TNF receptor-associated factor 5 n=1 Tax=Acropora cervicornis TaxID=6130 RepID=A0AAD9QJR4_ACRCE|nr:TNF receptor-associated factor 5 [Acropora cervicornis]